MNLLMDLSSSDGFNLFLTNIQTNKNTQTGVWQNIEIWGGRLLIERGPKQFVVKGEAKFEEGPKTPLHTMPATFHCVKHRNFTYFPGVKILRKSAVMKKKNKKMFMQRKSLMSQPDNYFKVYNAAFEETSC